MLGRGHGRFIAGPALRVERAREGYTLAIGDIDEDGRPDVVASSFESDVVTVMLGR
jgi:hypothetical protein